MKARRTLALLACILTAGSASARPQMAKGYQFPAGEPVNIVILRPDVAVGSLTAGGVEEPNADWTSAARDNLAKALDDNQGRRGAAVVAMPQVSGDDAKVVDDYQKLFRAVSQSIYIHKFGPLTKLPTKKDTFDWTLGPGAARLGQIGGANYALLLYTHDSFGTAGRKARSDIGRQGPAVGDAVGRLEPSGRADRAQRRELDARRPDPRRRDLLQRDRRQRHAVQGTEQGGQAAATVRPDHASSRRRADVRGELSHRQQHGGLHPRQDRAGEFLGGDGFRFTYTYVAKDEVERQGVGEAAVRDGKLYVITYEAPHIYYFDHWRDAYDKLVDSAVLIASPARKSR
jgi:hypothetical protein